MSRALQNIMHAAAARRMAGMGMTHADYVATVTDGQPQPWDPNSGASLPGMAPVRVAMHGLGDIPADYGGGPVFAPNDGQGPLGALPAAVTDFWAGLPTAGKIAVGVGAYMLLRRFFR